MLGIPEVVYTRSAYVFERLHTMFLLCSRLAWHSQQKSFSVFFGWSQSSISECINWTLDFIDRRWGLLLQDFDSGLLPEFRISTFTSVIHEKGAPLDSCWGFLDCTLRPICRTTVYQRQAYNCHKKQYTLKYSASMCHDGIIYHLYGPEEGRRNDNHLLDSSGLLDRC